MRKIYIIILLFSLLSCNDKINIVKLDNWAKTGTDYTELYSFLNTAIQNTDYLSSISSSAQTIISTKSGKKFTIKEQCNYFTMNTLGALSHNNKEIAVKLKVRDTWYNAPNLEISSEYRLSINGLKTNIVSSGVNIINCGKFVYFYIEGQVFALKSEINEAFNPPLPKDKSLLKVLFVGNSFNVDATTHLPGILNANGSDRVFMGRVYHGGCTLPMYNTNYDTPKYCSYRVFRPGQSDWDDNEEYDSTLKYAIEAEDWDIITFMEYSGNSACWTWNDTESGHINSLIKHCFDAHPDKRPTIMFMLTQTFALNHPNIQTSQKAVIDYFKGDQMAMYKTITDFAQSLVNNTCIDDVISTGTAIQNLRTSRLNTDLVQDLSRDGFHLDYGIGRYTAACTVFYNIFEPVLGLSLDNNSYRYYEESRVSTHHSIPVTDDNVVLCRKAARLATDHPFTLTNMSSL